MRGIAYLFFAVVALSGAVYMARASGHADGEAAPLFGITIPPGSVSYTHLDVYKRQAQQSADGIL